MCLQIKPFQRDPHYRDAPYRNLTCPVQLESMFENGGMIPFLLYCNYILLDNPTAIKLFYVEIAKLEDIDKH